MRRPELDDLLIGTATATLVLLISLMVGKLLDLLEMRVFIVGVAIFFFVVVGIVGLVHLMSRTEHRKEVEHVTTTHLEEIEVLLKGLRMLVPPTGFPWLVSDAELIAIEGKALGEEVWIVSPDLAHDTVRADIQKAVRKNLKRGLNYTYIVPNNERITALLPALETLFSSQVNRLRVVRVTDEVFRGLAIRHIAIYNPCVSGDEAPHAYLELPIQGSGFWVKLSEEHALTLTGRVRQLLSA
jgi:hypothetical protein